jgi:hypothetical protein
MLWATHRRIADEVMRRLGLRLSSAEHSKLMEGVIAPDKLHEVEQVHAYPHHYGKSEVIKQYLLKARQDFLKSDSLNAYYNLGVALHYIQDAHTSYPSFLGKHQEWEEWIENSYIVSNQNIEATIQQTVKNRRMWRLYSAIAQQLSREVEGRDATLAAATLNCQTKNRETIASPKVDLYLGFRGSYVVAKSVLGPRTSPALEAQLGNNLTTHEKQLHSAEADFSNMVISLICARDRLAEKKASSTGFMAKLKNWINELRLGFKEESVRSSYNRYSSGNHLQIVTNNYAVKADEIARSYGGWYNYQIPQLTTSIVPKELLELETASKVLGLEKQALRGLLIDRKIAPYSVGGVEIVRRSDLDGLLAQSPINGLDRCPFQYRELDTFTQVSVSPAPKGLTS